MSKHKPTQSQMFNNGEELPIFTNSAYGTAVTPFVERDTGGKQSRMFPAMFDELAKVAAAERGKRAVLLGLSSDKE